MLNAAVGVQRAITRLRSGTGRPSRAAVTIQQPSSRAGRTLSITRHLRAAWIGRPRPSRERAVYLLSVGVIACAVGLTSVERAPAGPTGNTSGVGVAPRIALGGAIADSAWHDAFEDGYPGPTTPGQGNVERPTFADVTTIGLAPDDRVSTVDPLGDDGILAMPVLASATTADGAMEIRTYRVRSGDTLSAVAAKFHVSATTVWWANNLKTKTLKSGQALRIPPVNGAIVTVRARDTLQALAAKYRADAAQIVRINGLQDPTLVVGTVLTIPGAHMAPIPTPKRPQKPAPKAASGGSTGGSTRPPTQYAGGAFGWPVAGGEISQYFHYGHYAIDIAADSGTRVMAAAAGVVTFAGWKSNGGGYQVWIAHGSGLFTTYNHMSSISVGSGQHVSKGQQVGRVGMTGNATGPHLHFEVWRGPIWDGGTRVNPLIYL